MGFNLPRLTGWVDCPPYDGMQIECWLNPTTEEYQPPESRQPWDKELYWLQGRLFLRLRVPAELSDTGAEEVIELGSERAIYDLLKMHGFDQSILQRALAAWSEQRQSLLEAARKN